MRFLLLFGAFLCMGCQDADVNRLFERYLWQNRVLLVFAPQPDDARLQAQRKMLAEHRAGMAERDMVTWQFINGHYVMVDEERKAQLPVNAFYEHFEIKPDAFAVIVIGKDGTEKLRQYDAPVSKAQLFSLIDAMPMRQREMQEPN